MYMFIFGWSKRALTSTNYKHNKKYYKNLLSKTNKRKRDITYFNPPFSLTVSCKIGKQFLNIINTSFDENYLYEKNNSIEIQLKYHTVIQLNFKVT